MELMKRNLLLFLLLPAFLFSRAQQLKRKGSLGVAYYQQLPDSLAKLLQYKEGAVVQFTVPDATAASLGIKPNDIITRVNEKTISGPQSLLPAVKNLRAGETITVTVIRNKQPLQLTGTIMARPMETSSTADLLYGEFAYKNGYVRTIYKTLKGKKPVGTIYFLQGLPCYSMDNFKELDKTKQALDAMVDRGFAVYRMEKADMGDNSGMPPCETMGFKEELEMYRAGYKHLLTLQEVDTAKIFLFGHSMGGVTAPLLAQEFQPKGVVVYGTVFKPWMDYLLDAFLIQSQYWGDDLAVIRETLETIKPAVYDYFYSDKTAEEICETPSGRMAMEQLLNYDVKTKLAASGRSPLCHKELNQQNLARAWRNTTSYVLAIYGECDIAAIHPDDHQALVNYVNKIHPGRGEFWLAPKTTHTFEEIGTMEEFMKMQADPAAFQQYAAVRFNPKVFDYTCNWMKSVLDKP
jgi:uncharacterized protein